MQGETLGEAVAESSSEPQTTGARASPPRLSDVVPVAALVALVTTLFSMRPFVASELRYVDATRAMAERGDWVVPHLAGVPYMEKPILFYWLSAAAQWLLGDAAAVVRMPSILGVTAMLTVAFALAFELRGREFARGTVALLLGCIGVVPMATALTTDPLFSGTLAVAWYGLWRHLQAPRSWWKWVFWVALAAAMLAKGPLGPALVGASGLVLVIAERRIAALLRVRLFVGGAVFLALCAPWHVALWMRDPRLVEFFYVRQNVQAAVDGHVNHAKPVYYYVPVLLGLLFPYSVLVVTALVAAFRRLLTAQPSSAATRVRMHVFLAAVVIGPLLLLSASASKLGTYVLPLLPFLGILVAREAARAVAGSGRLARVATTVPAVALLAAVAVGVPRMLDRYDMSGFRPAYVPAVGGAVVCLVAGLVVSAWMAWRGRRQMFVPMGVGVLAALCLAVPVAIDPGARFDARFAARELAPEMGPDDVVIAAGGEVQDYSIQIELDRRIHILGRAREVGMGHFIEFSGPTAQIPSDPTDVDVSMLPESPWLLDDRRLRALWSGERRVWLFGDESDVSALRARSRAEIHTLYDDGKLVVFSNRANAVR